MFELRNFIDRVLPLDAEIMKNAQVRLDNLTKPIGSLGRLESIVVQLSGITGNLFPRVDKKSIIIMCADNGVVDEGVSSCPKSVTATVTKNFTRGLTGVNVLANHAKSDIAVIDIGVDADFVYGLIENRKIRRSTGNIVKGPAMEREEAIRAIEVGIDVVTRKVKEGIQLFGTGEMGIGNTTTSSAIVALYYDGRIEDVVGKGAGLTKEAYRNKIDVVKMAIEINKPDKTDPVDVLAKVGGLDIAGLVGCYIGAAINRVPIVLDGFISGSAALIATKIEPKLRDYMIPSHTSAEPGAQIILNLLDMEAMLKLDMRLGEGTGAALAFHIIDAAIDAYSLMGTFEDAKIEPYKPLE